MIFHFDLNKMISIVSLQTLVPDAMLLLIGLRCFLHHCDYLITSLPYSVLT